MSVVAYKITFSVNLLRICQTDDIKKRKWILYPEVKSIPTNWTCQMHCF